VESKAYGEAEACRGQALQCVVRTLLIVAIDPLMGNLAHLLQGTEEITVENLFAIGSIEAFDVSILDRLSGADEIQWEVIGGCNPATATFVRLS